MTTMKTTLSGCAAVCVALLASPSLAQDDDQDRRLGATTAPAHQTRRMSDPYLLDVCVVSGEKLGSMGEPVDIVVANRLVRFCCSGCIGAFYKAPAVHLAELNEAWPKSHVPQGDADHGRDHDDDHDDHGHDHDAHDDHDH